MLALVGAAGLLPVIVVGALQIGTTSRSDPSPSSSGRADASAGVAMSSPVDPRAKFFWELPREPRSLVPLDEIVEGGPPPDGIPALDAPSFETPRDAEKWLATEEPVLAFERGGDARAYPLQILIWHEIVNDVVAGEPVAITYCPLCNSAIVFSRRAGGRVLDFGTSGRLYRSDLVMYDRQTKSLWPQIDGRAVVGPLIGVRLRAVPSSVVSWSEWRTANPTGRVLSRRTGFSRSYGRNPYVGYDAEDGEPYLFRGRTDGRLPAMARVVAVDAGGKQVAYPFTELAARAPVAVHDRVGGREIVVFFRRGTGSALDTKEVGGGRDVGASGVFRPVVGGRRLTFRARGGWFVDGETGTRWNLLGRAVGGPLRGSRLAAVAHVDTFWFAWAAFKPATRIWSPP